MDINDYYPFGMSFLKPEGVVSVYDPMAIPYNYKYNGKELQETGMYDYGARFYMPDIGRWGVVDKLTEKFISTTAYNYCNNNPIINIDLDGNEWFYYSTDGKSDPTWNWHDGHEYKTGVKDTNGKEVILTGVSAVVVFQGSRNEKLGTKEGKYGYIDGEGAITATVTVYGPKGADDIHTLTGYTMSSNAEKFGAVDEGTYNGNYDAAGKSGSLKSNWAVENRGKVRNLDGGINPYRPSQFDFDGMGGYKDGIFIHSSNRNGYAGEIEGGKSGISVGCFLIAPKDWDKFNEVMSGVKDFKVQVFRYTELFLPNNYSLTPTINVFYNKKD
jgi:RHS repeat-associated protein